MTSILGPSGAPIPKVGFKGPGHAIAQFANRVANGKTRSFVILEVGDGSPCTSFLHPDAGPNDLGALAARADEFLQMAEATLSAPKTDRDVIREAVQ